jgi:hypothetical protein
MTEPVHVFIATTAGLVSIRAIQHRSGQSLASFVTIAGTSKVASITPRYRNFVDKNTSPLPRLFKQDSYHMVIDSDIHQGESWQLACAIAHLLYVDGKLGSGEIASGDAVIIATGEVDAANAKVSLVTHLAQKCLNAQKQISRWQQHHCSITFFVPEQNYRQPLPDIPFYLTPVSNIDELQRMLVDKGVITESTTLQWQHTANRQRGQNRLSKVPAKIINWHQHSSLRLPRVSGKWLKGLAGVALLSGILWGSVAVISDLTKQPSVIMQYQTKIFEQCQPGPDNTLALTRDDAPIIKFEPLPLQQLCRLDVVFKDLEYSPKTLWLVADSYAVVPLTLSTADESNNLWTIPLPSWQEESRRYTLMIFDVPLDASDAQSLRDYLSNLYRQQQPVNLDVLSQWTNYQNLSARFISHSLEK